MRATVLGLIFLLAASSAQAEERVLAGRWIKTPSWSQMQAAFPAMAKDKSGSVTLRCAVSTAGGLSGCVNQGEKPSGQGFYEAALNLAPLFVAAVPQAAPGDTYRIDVSFSFLRPGPKEGRVLRSPKWVDPMSVDEAKALFPAKAAAVSVNQGAAILQCQITLSGALRPCTVLGETPKALGFGEAALATAERMAMNPWNDGFPVEGLALTFRLTFSR